MFRYKQTTDMGRGGGGEKEIEENNEKILNLHHFP